MSIAAEIVQVLSDLQVITGLLQNVLNLQQQGPTLGTVDQHVQEVIQQNGLIYGQTIAILAQERQIWADLTRQIQALGVQVGIPQQATQPVNLPSTPPVGYGGATASAAADAVWNHPNFAGYAMGDTMRSLVYFFDGLNAQLSFPSPTGGPFRISANIGAFNAEPWLFSPDYGIDSILPTDATVGAWLNRVHARGETWSQDPDSLYWRTFGLGNPLNNTTWYCTLSQVEFDQIKRDMAGGSVVVPPIWPGLSGVTLGSAHAIAPPGEDITIACDGAIVEITGVPSWAGKFQFGAAISWRNIGAMSFTSDHGEEEFPQTWGFERVVFLPKAMAHASGYVYRAAVGVTGTITPFTIN